LERILITEEDLRARVAAMAAEITRDYHDQDLLLVGVLKGAAIFMCDLIRRMPVPLALDFVAASSYGNAASSSGAVRMVKELDEPVRGRNVLLVEDIVDTGITVDYLVRHLRRRRAASVKVATLLDKPSRRQVVVPLDYVGFTVPDVFLVGYGLDYRQRYRSLPFIAVLSEEAHRIPARPSREVEKGRGEGRPAKKRDES
jgi:hypoxanthine phosphoribosyltransferase